jgi:methyl-accepting chemotaxis protein
MISSRLIVVPLVCAALAGGCGGDDDGGGGGTSATEWADGVCSAISDWTGSIKEATDSLQGGNLSEESLKNAGNDVSDATQTFVDDLRDLGKPDLEAGDEAKQSVDQLADDVDEGVDKIKSAADDVNSASSAAQAFSTVSAALASMSQAISKTFNELEQLDAEGELKSAFEDADSCKELSKE